MTQVLWDRPPGRRGSLRTRCGGCLLSIARPARGPAADLGVRPTQPQVVPS
jgi:hypothetical protein